jgi:hypothetical protein
MSLKLKSTLLALIGVMGAIVLSGCGGGSGATGSGGGTQPPKGNTADWTVLVYLNAANSLQGFGGFNVHQMEQAGSTPNVNIVVQWKQGVCADCSDNECNSLNGNCYNPDWKDTRRYYIVHNTDPTTIKSTLVQDLGPNIDMGNWQTLQNFIVWGQQNYPANHYALIVWDHGEGWVNVYRGLSKHPQSALVKPRSISLDETTMNEIETWQLSQALTGLKPLDVVAFDACLMQMTEIAYEIRNQATYMVGSEDSTPANGYPYMTFLSDLDANPTMSPLQFSQDIVSQTVNYYSQNPQLVGTQGVTQSVVSLAQMTNLNTSLNTFADALLNNDTQASVQQAAIRAEQNAQGYSSPNGYYENLDLWDYSNWIKNNTTNSAVVAAANSLQNAIGSAVVYQKLYQDPNSHGLAIYVPVPSDYDSAYGNLALARVNDWPKWLQFQAQL